MGARVERALPARLAPTAQKPPSRRLGGFCLARAENDAASRRHYDDAPFATRRAHDAARDAVR